MCGHACDSRTVNHVWHDDVAHNMRCGDCYADDDDDVNVDCVCAATIGPNDCRWATDRCHRHNHRTVAEGQRPPLATCTYTALSQ